MEILQEAITNHIHTLIKEADNSVLKAKEELNKAQEAIVQVGEYFLDLPKNKRAQWLKDNNCEVPIDKMQSYISVASTFRNRPDHSIDHRFFKLLEIVEPRKKSNKAKKITMPKWINWTNKLNTYIHDVNNDKTIPVEHLEAIAEQLKPLALFVSKANNKR